MLTRYHVVLLKASSCGVKFIFSLCPFWSQSTCFNLWIASLHVLYHVKMLTNILERFQISCHIYSAVKFRTVFLIGKSWTGYERVISQWNSRNPIDLIFVELILKSFLYFIKDLEYGIPYLCISKQLQVNVFSPLNNLWNYF